MAIITISRQYGSQGDEIAHQVCEALGYRYFDKRTLECIAASIGVAEGECLDVTEDTFYARHVWERLLENMIQRIPSASLFQMVNMTPGMIWKSQEYVNEITEPVMVGSWIEDAAGNCVKQLRLLGRKDERVFIQDVILSAYQEGNFVIVGRGGQIILKGKPDVLHVRIVASEDARAANLAMQQHINIETARTLIHEHDRTAADYIKTLYYANWADPLLYHLVINTDTSTREFAVQTILTAAQRLLEDNTRTDQYGFRQKVFERLRPQLARMAC